MKALRIPHALYLIILTLFFSCQEELDSILDKEKEAQTAMYNGEYYGYTYNGDNLIITDWFFKIENGKIYGKFHPADDYQIYEGSINENGEIQAFTTFETSNMRQTEALTITFQATISLEKGTLSGTWEDQNKNSGKIEGQSIVDKVKLYEGEYYGYTYNSSNEVITDWYFKIEGGIIYGKYSAEEEYQRFDSSVSEDGTFMSTSNYETDGMDIQINSIGEVSLDDGSISGTWTSSIGDTGTFSGSKI